MVRCGQYLERRCIQAREHEPRRKGVKDRHSPGDREEAAAHTNMSVR
jgi:hypothetical protein